MSRSKQFRLHQISRIKHQRQHYWHSIDLYFGTSQKYVSMTVITPCRCSCFMCGNPRKWFHKITVHEKRHLDILHDEMKELDDDTIE